jgi:serine/threonine protein kinase
VSPQPDFNKQQSTGMLNINANQFISEKKGKITKDYKILELVGKGGFGEVKKVVHLVSGDVRAMKIVKKDIVDDSYIANLTNEINILK